MRSYLQRMAASALSRERAIHPVLGSLWAPQPRADSFDASDDTSAPGIKPHQSTNVEHHSQLPVQFAQMQSLHAESEQRSAGRSSEWMPQTEAHPGMPMRHSSEAQQMYETSALLPVASQAERADASQEIGSESPQRSFRPLVVRTSQQDQASPNIAAPLPHASRVDLLRRQPLAQPAREPDSIEIHIGRIEVLAAQPQPTQRPAAQPVKKSLDLGEYLRRGGRAR